MKKSIVFLLAVLATGICLCFISPGSKTSVNSPTEVDIGRESVGGQSSYIFSIVYDGKLYEGMGIVHSIPIDAKRVGVISEITEAPEQELESSWGKKGDNVYSWTEDGITWIGVEIVEGALDYWNEPHAFAQQVADDDGKTNYLQKPKEWITVY